MEQDSNKSQQKQSISFQSSDLGYQNNMSSLSSRRIKSDCSSVMKYITPLSSLSKPQSSNQTPNHSNQYNSKTLSFEIISSSLDSQAQQNQKNSIEQFNTNLKKQNQKNQEYLKNQEIRVSQLLIKSFQSVQNNNQQDTQIKIRFFDHFSLEQKSTLFIKICKRLVFKGEISDYPTKNIFPIFMDKKILMSVLQQINTFQQGFGYSILPMLLFLCLFAKKPNQDNKQICKIINQCMIQFKNAQNCEQLDILIEKQYHNFLFDKKIEGTMKSILKEHQQIKNKSKLKNKQLLQSENFIILQYAIYLICNKEKEKPFKAIQHKVEQIFKIQPFQLELVQEQIKQEQIEQKIVPQPIFQVEQQIQIKSEANQPLKKKQAIFNELKKIPYFGNYFVCSDSGIILFQAFNINTIDHSKKLDLKQMIKIPQFKFIDGFDIPRSNIGSEGFKIICDNWKQIQTLYTWDCKIQTFVGSSLETLYNLKDASFSNNPLRKDTAQYLVSHTWNKLQELRITFVDGSQSYKILMAKFKQAFPNLKRIYLRELDSTDLPTLQSIVNIRVEGVKVFFRITKNSQPNFSKVLLPPIQFQQEKYLNSSYKAIQDFNKQKIEYPISNSKPLLVKITGNNLQLIKQQQITTYLKESQVSQPISQSIPQSQDSNNQSNSSKLSISYSSIHPIVRNPERTFDSLNFEEKKGIFLLLSRNEYRRKVNQIRKVFMIKGLLQDILKKCHTFKTCPEFSILSRAFLICLLRVNKLSQGVKVGQFIQEVITQLYNANRQHKLDQCMQKYKQIFWFDDRITPKENFLIFKFIVRFTINEIDPSQFRGIIQSVPEKQENNILDQVLNQNSSEYSSKNMALILEQVQRHDEIVQMKVKQAKTKVQIEEMTRQNIIKNIETENKLEQCLIILQGKIYFEGTTCLLRNKQINFQTVTKIVWNELDVFMLPNVKLSPSIISMISERFTNLKQLYLPNCGIETIKGTKIQRLTQLSKLSLSENPLKKDSAYELLNHSWNKLNQLRISFIDGSESWDIILHSIYEIFPNITQIFISQVQNIQISTLEKLIESRSFNLLVYFRIKPDIFALLEQVNYRVVDLQVGVDQVDLLNIRKLLKQKTKK